MERAIVLGGLLSTGLLAQAWGQGIFTCVDAKGRRLTADRPIAECTDREQTELGPTGLVRRKIGPQLTAVERAAADEKARKALEERNRLAEEKKRDRALLTRYPDRAAHDKERAASMAQADGIIATANRRQSDLAAERQRLDAELEFFKNDPSKVPAKLKRQLEENANNVQAQKRFILSQEEEKRRVSARYDEELAKLKQLWPQLTDAATMLPTAGKR
jgi:chromosome segregation ATPase